jgi:hypothetical protein
MRPLSRPRELHHYSIPGAVFQTTYDVTPAHSIGAAASELKAAGIGVT